MKTQITIKVTTTLGNTYTSGLMMEQEYNYNLAYAISKMNLIEVLTFLDLDGNEVNINGSSIESIIVKKAQ